ncbi:hypothetical protein ED21_32225 [Erythrobacter sp. SD-21]|nr:hypothetical protein ED21_32225 [Erythrobacter sp. SD-21]
MEAIDHMRIVSKMTPEIVNPIGYVDVTLVFEKPDKAPDTRRKIGLVGCRLR